MIGKISLSKDVIAAQHKGNNFSTKNNKCAENRPIQHKLKYHRIIIPLAEPKHITYNKAVKLHLNLNKNDIYFSFSYFTSKRQLYTVYTLVLSNN